MSEAVDKLLKANAEASEKHRIAYGKAMYNRGIDDCIKAIINHEQERYINANPKISCENLKKQLVYSLEYFKKPLP